MLRVLDIAHEKGSAQQTIIVRTRLYISSHAPCSKKMRFQHQFLTIVKWASFASAFAKGPWIKSLAKVNRLICEKPLCPAHDYHDFGFALGGLAAIQRIQTGSSGLGDRKSVV